MNKKTIVLITGVSGSGKTTLQEEMLSRGWTRPINYTTREPRDKEAYERIDEEGDFTGELEEYVFISEERFDTLNKQGVLLEAIRYNNNLYGVGNVISNSTCIVVNPEGKNQILSKLAGLKDYKILTVFLDCSKDEQKFRLKKRGDSKEEIIKRANDFEWILPSSNDLIVEALRSSKTQADIIEGFIK